MDIQPDEGSIYSYEDISYNLEVNTSQKEEELPAASSTPIKHLSCANCTFKTTHKASLSRHLVSVHSSNRNYACETCQKVFARKDCLDEHSQIHKTTGSQFLCEQCSKCFTTRQGLYCHKKQHMGQAAYTCDKCTKAFMTKDHFIGHTNRFHLKIKPFKCRKCDSSFYCSSAMSAHEKTCVGDKSFHCSLCESAFASKKVLDDHMQGKHGNTKYECACGKKYMWRQSHTRHQAHCTFGKV